MHFGLVREAFQVSGINLGPNLGDDLTHSGTVAAAIEGLALGLPSIAFSQQGGTGGEYSFTAGAAYAARLAREVLTRGLPPRVLLNVNFPAGLARGVRVTRVGEHRWEDSIVTRHDPEGREYHWVAGQSRAADAHDQDTDYGAVQAGFVSVTPVRLDLTARDLLEELAAGVRAWLEGSGMEVGTAGDADVLIVDDRWLNEVETLADLPAIVVLGSSHWLHVLAEVAPAGWAVLGTDATPRQVLGWLLCLLITFRRFPARRTGRTCLSRTSPSRRASGTCWRGSRRASATSGLPANCT